MRTAQLVWLWVYHVAHNEESKVTKYFTESKNKQWQCNTGGYTVEIEIMFDFETHFEPRHEKTGLRGFRPGPTQTGLYKLRKELEA